MTMGWMLFSASFFATWSTEWSSWGEGTSCQATQWPTALRTVISPLSCGCTLSEQDVQICEQNSAEMNDTERQLRKHQKLLCAWFLGADPGFL